MRSPESNSDGAVVFGLFPDSAHEANADAVIVQEQALGEVRKLHGERPELGSLLALILVSDMSNDEVTELVDNVASQTVSTSEVRQELLAKMRQKPKRSTAGPIG